MKTNVSQPILILNKSLSINRSSFGTGLFILIVGLLGVLFDWLTEESRTTVIGICLILIAPVFMFSMNCIAYDTIEKQLRLYRDYLIVKKGSWFSLRPYSSVSIYFQMEKPLKYSTIPDKVDCKVFEVHLTSDAMNNICLKRFRNLDDALDFQTLVSKKLELTLVEKPVKELRLR